MELSRTGGRTAVHVVCRLVRPAGLLMALLLCGQVQAQDMPDFLPSGPASDTDFGPQAGDRGVLTEGESYTDLLAAGYLLALPGAAMTGGVGILLPVGMHYYAGNPAGGNRAFLGILGGIGLGGVVGGFADRPEGAFKITRGMIYGALSGFFAWGIIDVLFFGHVSEGRDDAMNIALHVSKDAAGIGLSGHM